jgi:acyl carrier protein
MLPSTFILLDTLPLNPNGKVNRHALPELGNARPELSSPFAAPTNSTEEQLTTAWAEILSLDQVGIHDNFFDLGGHSLTATRVVSQVMKQFQLEIPLQSLFQSPTVAEMAAVIMEHQTKKLGEKDLERILAELESMSEEEAQRLLAAERRLRNSED